MLALVSVPLVIIIGDPSIFYRWFGSVNSTTPNPETPSTPANYTTPAFNFNISSLSLKVDVDKTSYRHGEVVNGTINLTYSDSLGLSPIKLSFGHSPIFLWEVKGVDSNYTYPPEPYAVLPSIVERVIGSRETLQTNFKWNPPEGNHTYEITATTANFWIDFPRRYGQGPFQLQSPSVRISMTADPSSASVGEYIEVELTFATSGQPLENNTVLVAVTNVTFTNRTDEFHFTLAEGHRAMMVKLSTTLQEKEMSVIMFDPKVRAGEYTYEYMLFGGIWSNMFLPGETREDWIIFQVREGLGPVDLIISRIWPTSQTVAVIRLAEAIPTA